MKIEENHNRNVSSLSLFLRVFLAAPELAQLENVLALLVGK